LEAEALHKDAPARHVCAHEGGTLSGLVDPLLELGEMGSRIAVRGSNSLHLEKGLVTLSQRSIEIVLSKGHLQKIKLQTKDYLPVLKLRWKGTAYGGILLWFLSQILEHFVWRMLYRWSQELRACWAHFQACYRYCLAISLLIEGFCVLRLFWPPWPPSLPRTPWTATPDRTSIHPYCSLFLNHYFNRIFVHFWALYGHEQPWAPPNCPSRLHVGQACLHFLLAYYTLWNFFVWFLR